MAEATGGREGPPRDDTVPARAITTTFGVGLTANATAMMLKVVFPLWAIELGLSATEIGIAIGMSAVLPFLLSIHGGALMDKFGTRRVTLVYAVTTAVLSPLYPALPFFAAVIVLQLLTGLTANMGWVGAQTLICGFSRGRTSLIAKFSVAGRIGTLGAPVLVGAVWDLAGPWGAFGLCGGMAGLVVAALWLVPTLEGEEAARDEGGRARLADMAPRLTDYVRAFSLIAIPAVAFVVAMSFIRISSSAIQQSFYVVYLQQIGLIGTLIGTLIALSEAGGLLGAAMAGFWERFIKPHWVFILFAALSVFFVSVTPALGGIFVLLAFASAARGYAQGLSQPVMFGILARAVGPGEQGTSIGLRTTSNRLASFIVPVIMGVVADSFDIVSSFYIVGGALIAGCAVVALAVRRIPGFRT